jgi:hypothetical protein
MNAEKFIHYTPAAMEIYHAHNDDTRLPVEGVTEYTYGNLTLILSDKEVEEFEEDTGVLLDSDVLNGAQFDKLMAAVEFEDHEKISIAMAQCCAAFGDFDDLPDELDRLCREGKLTCTSYENDNCPSFMEPKQTPVQEAEMLFVEYLDETLRGRAYRAPGDPVPKRYTVITCGTDEAHYHGDDLKAALFQLFLKTNVERMALHFVTDMLRYVGAAKMREIATRNRKELNPSVCHSHDFVDANEVMAEAFKNVVGRDHPVVCGAPQSDADDLLFEQAWSKAKEMINERFPAN